MVDVSGIPNMGFGGGGYFGGNAATGQPAMSAAQINAGMWGNYSPGAAQSTLNNIYGAGGFGAQPAYYAGLGAAYGRATGGFGGGGGLLPGQHTSFSRYSGGGIGSDAARAPNQPAIPQRSDPYAFISSAPSSGQVGPYSSAFSYNPASMGGGYGSATRAAIAAAGGNPYAGMYRQPDANPEYFNPATYAGSQGNYGIPYNGMPQAGDIGFSRQPSYPNIGYNPSMQNQFANPAMGGGAFQGRFGMGFPNAGTPSQYAPGAQMPPGFSGAYGADNPGGALPLNWLQSIGTGGA